MTIPTFIGATLTRAGAVLLVLLTAATAYAAPERHVRVIIDTSISMRGTRSEPANDPSGMAKLSTAMLYDLARFELGPDGSFKVLTFDKDLPSPCPSGIPSKVSSLWMTPGASREDFVRQVMAIDYDAPCTFFTPSIGMAVGDLESTRSGDDVKRVLVLVTDGLTEPGSKAEETRQLTELARRASAARIEFYVIAFGRYAKDNEDFFRGIFRFRQPGGTLGDVFADPPGDRLVENMIEIFKASFAYESETVSGADLNLDKGISPRNVAVLARYQPAAAPRFKVDPPKGAGGTSLKEPLASAVGSEVKNAAPPGSGRPVSYGVQWVLSPSAGMYRFNDQGLRPATIAILRPTNLQVTLRQDGANALDAAMVNLNMRLKVVVAAVNATSPDPGPVEVQFHIAAICASGAPSPECVYPGNEGWLGPSGGSSGGPEGREYIIEPKWLDSSAFEKPPSGGRNHYDGYVEVRVNKGGTLVATLPSPHRVRIYPLLQLKPDPPKAPALAGGTQTLRGGQLGCATFKLEVAKGVLNDSDYSLALTLPPDASTGAFSNSRWFLDDRPSADWKDGIKLSKGELLGNHRVCLEPSKRTAGGPGDIPLRLSLWYAGDTAYRSLRVIDDFTLQAKLDPPGWWERWIAWILLLAAALIAAALYMLLRRQLLPTDFDASAAQGTSTAALTPGRLVDPSLVAGLVSKQALRPVVASDGSRELGAVQPLDEELYCFRAAPGHSQVCQEDEKGRWTLMPVQADGGIAVEANRVYRIEAEDGSVHRFQVGYTNGAKSK
jgi:hypothetical protein